MQQFSTLKKTLQYSPLKVKKNPVNFFLGETRYYICNITLVIEKKKKKKGKKIQQNKKCITILKAISENRYSGQN